jgi:D-citramalate synthase
VNGLGERAGNASLASIIGILSDHLKVEYNVDETKLTKISKLVETFSGIRIPENKPLVGDNVFTQTCGVHADGDAKNNLYFNNLVPERFGRVRQYALGKTSGKANIKKNLEELGLELDSESLLKVTAKIIELGDKKKNVTTEDLPYIISDVLHNGNIANAVNFRHYTLSLTNGLKPTASVKIEINGKSYEQIASGDGQYDAFIKAVWKIYKELDKEHPVLVDYLVTIPPGGKSDALVETTISWLYNDKQYKTKALDPDQTEAAIKATEKMLNIIETNKL